MPVATTTTAMTVTPMIHDPKETKVRFGAVVEGVDLNELDGETFARIKEAVLTHKLLVFKGQAGLHPANQLKFVQM